ncbi:MAG: hypothetical protein V2I33_25500 [Kangiellaceae bacterium]|jgi:transposase|nr:hypothetical protein [Kangiellaceae bacterium]
MHQNREEILAISSDFWSQLTFLLGMASLNQNQVRQLVVHYHAQHPEASTYSIAKYFSEIGIAQRTVYNIIEKYAKTGQTSKSSGSGRPAEKMTEKKKDALVVDAMSETGLSQRDLARKYDISLAYVNKILQEYKVKAFKRQKVPATVSEQQKETQRIRNDRLYRELLSHGRCQGRPSLVMDDESYFTLTHSSIPSNQYYYATSRGDAEEEQKFSHRQKFEAKVLVWIAISDRGLSQAFFQPSGFAITKEVYSDECITRRLVPFLSEHHSDGNYLFWPDLASAHYAKHSLARLQELGVQFVPKEKNPPNVPQLRPVEDFWGLLKQEVYRHHWRAESIDQLKRRIQFRLRKLNTTAVCHMMNLVQQRLGRARRFGVQSAYH